MTHILATACSIAVLLCPADADRDVREDRVQELFEQGDAALAQEQYDEALRLYREARPIVEALVELDPDDTRTRRNLASLFGRMGMTHKIIGNMEYAIPLFERRHRELETVLSANPDDVQIQVSLATSHRDLGMAMWETGRIDEASSHYQSALEIDEVLVLADPTNVEYQRNLVRSLGDCAVPLLERRSYESAMTHLHRSHDILSCLLMISPNDTEVRYQLHLLLSLMGEAFRVQFQYESCLDCWDEALQSSEHVLDTDPDNEQWQYYRAFALGFRGEALVEARIYDHAEDSLTSSISILENLEDSANLAEDVTKDLHRWRASLEQCHDRSIADGEWSDLLDHPTDKLDLLLLNRCWLKSRDGDIDEVERCAQKLEEIAPSAGEREGTALIYAARAYAICAKLAVGWRAPYPYPAPEAEPSVEQLELQQMFIAKSLAIIETLLDLGYGGLAWAREEQDFAALHGLPEFEELISRSP